MGDFFFFEIESETKFLSVLRYITKELYFFNVCEKQFSNKVTIYEEIKAFWHVYRRNKSLKSTVLPQAEAEESASLGLRLRQHFQFLTLEFVGKKIIFEKDLINAAGISVNAES